MRPLRLEDSRSERVMMPCSGWPKMDWGPKFRLCRQIAATPWTASSLKRNDNGETACFQNVWKPGKEEGDAEVRDDAYCGTWLRDEIWSGLAGHVTGTSRSARRSDL